MVLTGKMTRSLSAPAPEVSHISGGSSFFSPPRAIFRSVFSEGHRPEGLGFGTKDGNAVRLLTCQLPRSDFLFGIEPPGSPSHPA